MNHTRNHAMILIKLLTFLIPSFFLLGCMTASETRLSIIHEQLTPQRIFYGEDGVIAVKVASHYYSYSSFDHEGKVLLPQYPPSEHYLIIHPSEITAFINHARKVENGTPRGLPDWPIAVSWTDFPQKTLKSQLYPNDFFVPASGAHLEPRWLNSGKSKEYRIGEAIPYQTGNEVIYLTIDHAPEIDLDRKLVKWGRIWKVPTALVLDSAFIVTMAPFILIPRLFDL